MARAKPSTDSDSPTSPSFEDALHGLESIVEAMEHENLALEDLVSYYEKGSKLLNRCETILQNARGRIELITLQHQNEAASEADLKSTDDGADDDDNDIRLF